MRGNVNEPPIPPDYRETVDVLAITGSGRSGSTLLAALLGSLPGFVAVGELGAVWRAARMNEACGCGLPFSQCPFWMRVGDSSFGGWGRVDVERMERLNHGIVRPRHLPLVFAPGRQQRLRDYTTAVARIYAGIRSITDARILIDSTKSPAYTLAMNKEPAVKMHALHLVRDSRAVAFSWAKTVARPEFADLPNHRSQPLGGLPVWKSGLEWLTTNSLASLLGRATMPQIAVRYEALVTDPIGEIRRIITFLDVRDRPEDIPGLRSGQYEAQPLHTVGGNRIRFLRGRLPLRLDEDWRTEMRSRDRFIVTFLTLPLLVAYGYTDLGTR